MLTVLHKKKKSCLTMKEPHSVNAGHKHTLTLACTSLAKEGLARGSRNGMEIIHERSRPIIVQRAKARVPYSLPLTIDTGYWRFPREPGHCSTVHKYHRARTADAGISAARLRDRGPRVPYTAARIAAATLSWGTLECHTCVSVNAWRVHT